MSVFWTVSLVCLYLLERQTAKEILAAQSTVPLLFQGRTDPMAKAKAPAPDSKDDGPSNFLKKAKWVAVCRLPSSPPVLQPAKKRLNHVFKLIFAQPLPIVRYWCFMRGDCESFSRPLFSTPPSHNGFFPRPPSLPPGLRPSAAPCWTRRATRSSRRARRPSPRRLFGTPPSPAWTCPAHTPPPTPPRVSALRLTANSTVGRGVRGGPATSMVPLWCPKSLSLRPSPELCAWPSSCHYFPFSALPLTYAVHRPSRKIYLCFTSSPSSFVLVCLPSPSARKIPPPTSPPDTCQYSAPPLRSSKFRRGQAKPNRDVGRGRPQRRGMWGTTAPWSLPRCSGCAIPNNVRGFPFVGQS